MYTAPLTVERLAASVWAVPPLARRRDCSLHPQANQKLISHLEAGGISTILYGGNAIMYHVAPGEYRALLELIAETTADDTLVIPSVGPAFGTMMDQATVLRDFHFPTAMILPQADISTSAGITEAVCRIVARFGAPVVLYIKHGRAVQPSAVDSLMEEGALWAIKYAVPRDNPAKDDYLRELVDAAGAERMFSGLGDQPARVHMRDFGLAGFTTGCGCIAPRLCMDLLAAIRAGDEARAQEIEAQFYPLEELRNRLGPIPVLHEAVTQAEIADMGPVIPLLSPVGAAHHDAIRAAALALLEINSQR